MNRRHRVSTAARFGLFALSALFVFSCTGEKKEPRRSAPIEARVELAAGQVEIEDARGKRLVFSGTPLSAPVTVTTADDARARIRLADGSTLLLRGGTTLHFEADTVHLRAGHLWLNTNGAERGAQRYRVGSISVTTAQAGLELALVNDTASLYVARGSAVAETETRSAEVQSGERLSMPPGAAFEVQPVSFWEDWTGGWADHSGLLSEVGAGTLYGVDFGGSPGGPARSLEIARQSIRAVIRDGFVETEVDQTFFNGHSRNVEGWYWFAVPPGAQVKSFALEANGALIEAELIERQQARQNYHAAANSGDEPALLEWVSANTFRARIFPVASGGTRRVVLRYLARLPISEGHLRFVHPMAGRLQHPIGEFSLTVDLGDEGTKMNLSTLAEARIEDGGRRVTMRRSGYNPKTDFILEASVAPQGGAMRVTRHEGGSDKPDYVMVRYQPDVDWASFPKARTDVVLLVDTSGGVDAHAQGLRAATVQAVLHSLSPEDRFSLVALDVTAKSLFPADGLATAQEPNIAAAVEQLAARESKGASDLAASFDTALAKVHGSEQAAVIYVGDGWATSGEMNNEALTERLRWALSSSRARFFSVALGAQANLPLLSELARAGGGQLLQVDAPIDATERSFELAALVKTPTLTELEVDLGAGLDEVFSSAQRTLSRGDELMLLARTHHPLPSTVRVKGRIGGSPFEKTYPLNQERDSKPARVPRLWAHEKMMRLLGSVRDAQSIRGRVVALGLEYALMTPFTSFLALDSEEAYARQGIQRRGAATVVEHSSLQPEISERARTPKHKGEDFEQAFASKSVARLSIGGKDAPPPQEGIGGMGSKGGARDRSPAQVAPKPVGASSVFGNGGLGAPVSSALGGLQSGRGIPSDVKASATTAPVCRRSVDTNPCSDLSQRPLAERAVIWAQRLDAATGLEELEERFTAAQSSCEFSDWRAEATFLELLARRVSGNDAVSLLQWFSCAANAQTYLGRVMLRRNLDADLKAALQRTLLGPEVDWAKVDLELSAIASPQQRLERLRLHVARSPQDPAGLMRLCRALAATGAREEALLHGRRLYQRGLLSPQWLLELGDLLNALGQREDALRTYSEIVEFDADSADARQLLGDVLLARGWAQEAYSQFRWLTQSNPRNASAWLRMAAAAAEVGRLDEALRLERQVGTAEGTPGVNDTRRWAKLQSAARLARAIAAEPSTAEALTAYKRQLKELSVFEGPGRLVLLTWNDVLVPVRVTASSASMSRGEITEVRPLGLWSQLLPAAPTLPDPVEMSFPNNTGLKLTRIDISWDGKDLSVAIRTASPGAEDKNASL